MEGSDNTYNQFFNKIKAHLKAQKQKRKENLRSISHNRYIESSEDLNEAQYLKKTVKKGSKWWDKINRNYFKLVTQVLYQNMIALTTSEDVLEFPCQLPIIFTYYQQIIWGGNPYLFQDDCLRIVFRHQIRIDEIENSQIISYSIKNHNSKDTHKNTQSITLPKNINFFTFHLNNDDITSNNQSSQHRNKQIIKEEAKQIEIILQERCDDQKFILKCLRYEDIWRDNQKSEIQKQIQCWEDELIEQHQKNIIFWSKLSKVIVTQQQNYVEDNFESQIQLIKKNLLSNQTLMYFKAGYNDKISQQLEKALQYLKEIDQQQVQKNLKSKKSEEVEISKNATAGSGKLKLSAIQLSPSSQKIIKTKRKQFDTDCKICFCTKNQMANQVIYCDGCNTSLHQSCYGIQSFDEEASFLCDVCIYITKLTLEGKTTKYDAPCCQICLRNRFPMKIINEHFYHVSCLVLFNFAEIRDFQIILKPGITHETILKSVIQNQIDNDSCQYCLKNGYSGMKFHCEDSLCPQSFHPICAYLNGSKFKLSRGVNGLMKVEIRCRQHFTNLRGQLFYQVYIRRFLCNYKNTSEMNETKFTQCYQKQLEKLEKQSISNKALEKGIKRIIKSTPTINSVIGKRLQKQLAQTNKKVVLSSSTPKKQGKKEEQSEIKNMIRDYHQKKHY